MFVRWRANPRSRHATASVHVSGKAYKHETTMLLARRIQNLVEGEFHILATNLTCGLPELAQMP